MKKIISLFVLAGLIVVLSSCSASREYTDKDRSKIDDQRVIVVEHPISLADMLSRVPGVFVDERGASTRVTIRGGQPLFVVDGVPVGNTYSRAAHAVNIHDVASIEVLKSPSETTIYGQRAAHGVILIKTIRG